MMARLMDFRVLVCLAWLPLLGCDAPAGAGGKLPVYWAHKVSNGRGPSILDEGPGIYCVPQGLLAQGSPEIPLRGEGEDVTLSFLVVNGGKQPIFIRCSDRFAGSDVKWRLEAILPAGMESFGDALVKYGQGFPDNERITEMYRLLNPADPHYLHEPWRYRGGLLTKEFKLFLPSTQRASAIELEVNFDVKYYVLGDTRPRQATVSGLVRFAPQRSNR